MKCRLIVAPRAESDILQAYRWYLERSPELAKDFLRRVDAKLDLIAQSPQHFRKRIGTYRLAATERFPYGIYFIWDEAEDVIAVRRVLHFKQDRKRSL